MRGNNFLVLSIFLMILFSISAVADEVNGRTADGCSYKVINGQYLTTCPQKKGIASAAEPLGQNHAQVASASPVTSYGDIPMRRNTGAGVPSLPPQQPVMAPSSAPGSVSSAFERSEGAESALDIREDAHRERLRHKLIDQTYVGLLLGASNMKESNSGSTAGIGLALGTNINDTFGVELGYTYAKQKLNLGLASRGGNTDLDEEQQNGPIPSANDSSLSSHLFTGELQAHLTDPLKRLRPYLGAGFGWRSSTLTEIQSGGDSISQTLAGGSLHQNALGGLASAGTKLRLSKAFQLGFAFRYFFPLSRQDARLEQPLANDHIDGPAETKLSPDDDSLTGSSQYQVLGGLQYSF